MASGAVRYFAADDLSDGELTALLALDDPMAVAALAPLSADVRTALLDAHPADVAALVTTAAPDDLTWLAEYQQPKARRRCRALCEIWPAVQQPLPSCALPRPRLPPQQPQPPIV